MLRRSETPPRRRRSPAVADGVAVFAAAVLVTLAAVIGAILVERGVPVLAGAPPLLARWLPHVGPGSVFAVLIAAAVVLRGPEIAARLRWRPLLAAGYLTSVAWTVSLALIDGWTRGVVDQLTTPTEYIAAVPRVTDIPRMIDTFAGGILSLQPDSWTTHVAGHPPGALLTFVTLDRLGLSGGAPAGVLCILVGASAAVAVAVTLRALGAEDTARAALPFGVLFPGAIWVGASADGLFAGVLAWGVALLAVGAVRSGLAGYVAALCGGVLLGFSLYLSYGMVLAGLLPLVVLLVTRRLSPFVLATLGAAAVVVTFTALGFWWFEGVELVQIRYYQPGEYGLRRPYGYWVWANLAALALAVGPATVAGLRRLAAAPRGSPGPLALLVAAAAIAILVADLSGLSKAEVERIWLLFAVWLVAACALLPRSSVRLWLASQAVLALVINHVLLTTW
ncbi:MAG: hypothetical protein GEV09_01875 [Pseudonocardiaceae bacterium]|nr:hypothetical protein [Pseudonocardiaceae bacterium]